MWQILAKGVFLLLRIAVVFIGSIISFKGVYLSVVYLAVLALNIIRLVRAAMFRRALKDGQRIN